ncbi:MBL fold metallo-hydrolase [Paenibacillus sambharensis]|uniref:MBL fold metallo-hydrolase n=1 Tax=Paenibacillus sambharensis TaxID=1803190 RepID=A0A2W1M0U3_9BACL|nr:MBL fold metallo-hydrolase [Paenibacillus sambharensis]PZD97551.1 MBL fold metallo-hydrolase [Paenibacillus sambharensis]
MGAEIDKSEHTAVSKVRAADLLRWRIERLRKKKDLSFRVPVYDRIDNQFIKTNRTESAITWIGHCTFLIQIGGLNIVTDPVWASRMGLETRLAEPGISIGEMPEIDMVLVSHNHYDHLDFASIARLPGKPVYLVPEGLGQLFKKKGYNDVQEFSWWDERVHRELKITFLPSLHWSRRGLRDINASLWGGWMIEYNGVAIYFVGDSGYYHGFELIGKRYKIDYVLMPIGAYEPEWFMANQHMTPEEAVKAYTELNAGMFIPMHYDAFRLADDTPQEALLRVRAAWEQQQLDPNRLHTMALGETLRV